MTSPSGTTAPQPTTPAESAAGKPKERNFTGKQVAKGSAWTLAGFGISGCVRLCSSLVLTRVIPDAPAAYGVMALVYAFFTGLQLFSDVGLGQLLIQNPRGTEAAYRNTAFFVQVVRGFIVWLIALGLAPLIASAYPTYDQLQELLSVTALSAVLGGLGSTSLFMFRRQMRVGTMAKIELVSQVCGTGVTLAHALIWPSVWAMVTGALATVAIRTGLSHALNDVRDRMRWDRDAGRQLKTLGRWVMLSTALTFLSTQADRLIFGKLVSMEELGVFSVAAIYTLTVNQVLTRLTVNIAYPVMCQHERAKGEFTATYRVYSRMIAVLGGMAMMTLCGGGGALMETLYTGAFAEGGWILQYTALGAWFNIVLGTPRTHALLAKAKPQQTAAANFAKVVALCVLVPTGHYIAGFEGSIMAYASTSVVRYLVLAVANRKLGVGSLLQDAALTAGMVAGSGGLAALDAALKSADVSPLVRTIVAGSCAVLAWSPACVLSLRAMKRLHKT